MASSSSLIPASLEERGVIFEKTDDGYILGHITIDSRKMILRKFSEVKNVSEKALEIVFGGGLYEINVIDKQGTIHKLSMDACTYDWIEKESRYYLDVKHRNITFLTQKVESLEIKSFSKIDRMRFKMALIGLIRTNQFVRRSLRWNPEAFKILESLVPTNVYIQKFNQEGLNQEEIEKCLANMIKELCGDGDTIAGPA